MATILGAICVYLLIGIVFAEIYLLLNDLETFFAQGPRPPGDFLYFSFVTMTTPRLRRPDARFAVAKSVVVSRRSSGSSSSRSSSPGSSRATSAAAGTSRSRRAQRGCGRSSPARSSTAGARARAATASSSDGQARRLAQRRLDLLQQLPRHLGGAGRERDGLVDEPVGGRRTATRARWRPRARRRPRSPARSIAAAAWGPTASVRRRVWPPPGWRPIRAKRASKRASGAAMRTSQASARLSPAPTAGPFTAANIGRVQRWNAEEPLVDRRQRGVAAAAGR